MIEKSIEEINQKIKDGSVCVVTAEQMPELVDELGIEEATRQVDVVTTGTFGAMCSSGAWLNFGHSDPPIKMQKVWLNDVEAYTGLAAVDAYIGATQLSESKGMEYGGAHVIEDIIAGKEIDVHATAYGTDCYPRKVLDTTVTKDDINQAVMMNPRNAYQKYNVATNLSDKKLHTYMGTLLPDAGNATYSAAGVLSPLHNDPNFETIGVGSRIFLGGAQGFITGDGTQHSPENNFSTIMVQGDMKKMNTDYVRGSSFHGYGTSLYLGIGIPIPIINERVAQSTAIRDCDIVTNILDYGVARRARPILGQVNYEELKSGIIDINGKEVRTSAMSSMYKARKIADELKDWIVKGNFLMGAPAQRLSSVGSANPMKQTAETLFVSDIMSRDVDTIVAGSSIEEAARKLIDGNYNHLPVTTDEGKLVGIITAWDISKAVAMDKHKSIDDIMTRNVETTTPSEPIDIAARKLETHQISALPVVKDGVVLGIVTSDDLSKLFARRQ